MLGSGDNNALVISFTVFGAGSWTNDGWGLTLVSWGTESSRVGVSMEGVCTPHDVYTGD